MKLQIDVKTLNAVPKIIEALMEDYPKYFKVMWKGIKSIEIETNPRYACTIVLSKKAMLKMEKEMGELLVETTDKLEKTMGPIQKLIEKLL